MTDAMPPRKIRKNNNRALRQTALFLYKEFAASCNRNSYITRAFLYFNFVARFQIHGFVTHHAFGAQINHIRSFRPRAKNVGGQGK